MLKITFVPNEVNIFCRVDPGIDVELIQELADAATIEAEEFLNTDFSIDDEPQEAPATVKLWVKNRIVQLYENRGVATTPDYTLLKPHRVYPFRG